MSKEAIAALRSGKMSRRDFNRALAAAGLSFAVMPLATRSSRAAGNLNFFTWGGYDVPEAAPQYAAKHGGPPDFSIFASEEEALQKMLAGFEPDLMHPCSYNIKRWKDAGVLQPIDVSRLPEYENIWERFRTIPETSFDGKVYFMPWDAGLSSVLYRTDLVDPADVADPSWSLLFNEKYKGKLSMYDTDTTFIELAARVRGWYKDYLHLSDEQLAEIKKMLASQRELMKFYWSDNTQLEQAIAAGEVVAAYAWSGSYAALKKQGVKVDYLVPKEGILGYSCGLVRHAKAPGDEQAAYDFLNAMLDPESGKWLIEQSGYFHSNRRTYKIVDPKILSDMGASDPEATFAALALDPEPEEPYRSKYIELVNNVKAGL
jgi:spermidine/putrescine-binding protein